MKKNRLVILLGILLVSIFALIEERTIAYFKTHPAPYSLYPDSDIIKNFHLLYHSVKEVHQKTNWLGVKIQQTPNDMWTVQEIMQEVQPDFVIETGTFKGGSALYFASLFHIMKDSGRVITVNIENQLDGAERLPLFQEHVIPLIGDSVSDEIINKIKSIVQDKSAIVLLDFDHHKNHVLWEMERYAQFVPIGSYLIVHDTNFNGNPVLPDFGPGPMEAVSEYLGRSRPQFEIDRSREKFLLTFYPEGFLKRVR